MVTTAGPAETRSTNRPTNWACGYSRTNGASTTPSTWWSRRGTSPQNASSGSLPRRPPGSVSRSKH